LKEYDYSQRGMYFVTICTQDRRCLFGEVVDGNMKLNEIGNIVKNEWVKLPKRFLNTEMGSFIIMPNHVHGIIIVGAPLAGARVNDNYGGKNRATARVAPTHIGNIIGAYKSSVYNSCLHIYKNNDSFLGKIWQRNYYEHIVRDEGDLNRIQEYIQNNPINWEQDELFV